MGTSSIIHYKNNHRFLEGTVYTPNPIQNLFRHKTLKRIGSKINNFTVRVKGHKIMCYVRNKINHKKYSYFYDGLWFRRTFLSGIDHGRTSAVFYLTAFFV